jgi:hypothetical protein
MFSKTLVGSLAAVVGVVVLGAAQASASSAPIVIPYTKTCNPPVCQSPAGAAVSLTMTVESFLKVGNTYALTATEHVVAEGIDFEARLKGHWSVAGGFIVLNGTVTGGSFEGARIHQRSNLVDESTSLWSGELRLMPASA